MIAEPSIQSLFLVTMSNGHELGTGSGFVVEHTGALYLVTNYHVAVGRNPTTGQPLNATTGAVPDTLRILHMMPPKPDRIEWEYRDERLFDTDEEPLWLEHPQHGRGVDVVALPLRNLVGVEPHPYDVTGAAPELAIGPSSDLSVIGFPFGRTAGGAFGIWTRGFVASEPDIDFDDLPTFLIDARTRAGQSGSPVIKYASGGMTPLANGDTAVFNGPVLNLLGVYSGRIGEESDLGIVWKLSALREIIEGQKRGRGGV